MGETLLIRKQRAIANRVADLLKEHGWTQRDLAQRTGMKDSYISRVLNAEANLTLRTIAVLERTLGKALITIP
jgi:transcriptional regulator with XRE-family HTH domain